MKYSVISTWKMSLEGCRKTACLLNAGKRAGDAIEAGIQLVESNPAFHSVGYGGLPDRTGHVTMDAGFMDGDTLRYGAVGYLEGFASAIAVAESLSHRKTSCFLCGRGAEDYAESHGFERRNNLTMEAYQKYLQENNQKDLQAYRGHDTVCFLAMDQKKTICAGTSTSGLFLKEPGRLGDTPLPGNGYYADSKVGAAAATGMGEEIMRGALSYEAVRRLQEGMNAQEAAESAVFELDERIKRHHGTSGSISLIVMDQSGNTGIGTNVPFSYVTGNEEGVKLYSAIPAGRTVRIHEVLEGEETETD